VVTQAHRGKGLARALKLLALEYARSRGVDIIVTENHPENAPILGLNKCLGSTRLRTESRRALFTAKLSIRRFTGRLGPCSNRARSPSPVERGSGFFMGWGSVKRSAHYGRLRGIVREML
jgi:GNAT superfamily N-acetyltransferase